MGVIAPTLPTLGQPNSTEDSDVRNTLLTIVNEINGNLDTANFKQIAIPRLHFPITNTAGPLNVSGTFTPLGGLCYIAFWGTGYAPAAQSAGLAMHLDGAGSPTTQSSFRFQAATDRHNIPIYIHAAGRLTTGTAHSVELRASSGLQSDPNDRFWSVVLELP